MKKQLLPELLVLSIFALGTVACGNQSTSSASSQGTTVSQSTPTSVPTSEPSSAPSSEPSVAPSSEPTSVSSEAPVHEHEYVHHDEVAATCTEEGKKAYYSCSGCDKIFTEEKIETTEASLVIPALGHDLTHHDAVAGEDCQHQGTIEYWSCQRCKKNFSDEEGKNAVESLVGEYGAHVYEFHGSHAASCTEEGNIPYYTCSVCGGYFDNDYNPTTLEAVTLPKKDHELEWQHNDEGHWQQCKNCDYKTDLVAHSYGEYEKGSAIGAMTASCDCGATDEKLMTSEDITLGVDLYGSDIVTDSTGTTWIGKSNDKQAYVFGSDGGSSESFLLGLPKVEFTKYSSVTFNFQVASGWFNIGVDSAHVVKTNGDGATGSFKVQRSYEGTVEATFQFDNNSTYPGDPLKCSYALNDQNVLNGLSSLCIFANSVNNADRCVYITSIELEATCDHVYSFVADEDAIGTSHNGTCAKCGAPSEESQSRVSQTGDVDYSVSTHGATIYRVNGGAHYDGVYELTNAVTADADSLSFAPDIDYACFRIVMPKVNYALYSSVSFPLTVADAHYGLGFNAGIWNESSGIRGKDLSVTLTISVNGENNMVATLACGEETLSTDVTAEDVYGGTAGLPIYVSVASTAAFVVGTPTLNVD